MKCSHSDSFCYQAYFKLYFFECHSLFDKMFISSDDCWEINTAICHCAVTSACSLLKLEKEISSLLAELLHECPGNSSVLPTEVTSEVSDTVLWNPNQMIHIGLIGAFIKTIVLYEAGEMILVFWGENFYCNSTV